MKNIFKIIVVIILFVICMGEFMGYQLVFTTGISMYPTFRDKQFILAKEVEMGELQENDIGLYWNPETETWINHRVIYKTKTGYIFKGDNNFYFDDFVPRELVKYKVIVY